MGTGEPKDMPDCSRNLVNLMNTPLLNRNLSFLVFLLSLHIPVMVDFLGNLHYIL